MDDEQREELEFQPTEQVEEIRLPDEAAFQEDATVAEDAVFADGIAGAEPPQIVFGEPPVAEDLLAREVAALQDVQPLETDLRIEPSAYDVPLTPQEQVFGKPSSPRMLDVSPQPHARKIPIAYEPQPSFETPDDLPGFIIRGPERPDAAAGQAHDMVYRHGDPENEPRVQLFSDSRPAQASVGPTGGGDRASEEPGQPARGQTLPRLLVTVSMANARSIFQDCIERASQTLGAKFHAACKSTVDDYARDRRAAERAANRW